MGLIERLGRLVGVGVHKPASGCVIGIRDDVFQRDQGVATVFMDRTREVVRAEVALENTSRARNVIKRLGREPESISGSMSKYQNISYVASCPAKITRNASASSQRPLLKTLENKRRLERRTGRLPAMR